MKRLLFLVLFLESVAFFSQKKKISEQAFLKDYSESYTENNSLSYPLRNYIDKFVIGEKFSRDIITEEEPVVNYNDKLGYYSYLYILDDCSISVWIKNNIIILKSYTVYDINDYMSMIKKLSVLDLNYVGEKGFDVGNDTYLQINKNRYEKYDAYHFYFLSLEYFILNDMYKSIQSK
ncbi:hypothetical protein U9K52_08545 [Chryseobacterium sp. MHB01]|uniref:hypothetical protein n=1 Tax=Chryseobacterium sp. MHB01 TaxID=3109433 RepID=UPI002AFF4DD5|nr:hypothetical protein [Chryseobacterium sp. MHB01]MEA1848957.1 hypothetical protein [Chryseobacterium sp. MHB01]